MARIELCTAATALVMLYCTWHPCDVATGLHGHAVQKCYLLMQLIQKMLFMQMIS